MKKLTAVCGFGLDKSLAILYNILCSAEPSHIIRRRIEVVITRLTRNQLYRKVPWVRIPPSPPKIKGHCEVSFYFWLQTLGSQCPYGTAFSLCEKRSRSPPVAAFIKNCKPYIYKKREQKLPLSFSNITALPWACYKTRKKQGG